MLLAFCHTHKLVFIYMWGGIIWVERGFKENGEQEEVCGQKERQILPVFS